VVEGGGLESRCTGFPYRGFESRPLRHSIRRPEWTAVTASELLDFVRRTKPGTKVYIVGVAVLPWLAILSVTAQNRGLFWLMMPLSGAPFVLVHTFDLGTAQIFPGIVGYAGYFALILLPLTLALNTRDAPVGRTLVWALVALALATHVALTVLALYLVQLGIQMRQLTVL
jgi:hypothetical protein